MDNGGSHRPFATAMNCIHSCNPAASPPGLQALLNAVRAVAADVPGGFLALGIALLNAAPGQGPPPSHLAISRSSSWGLAFAGAESSSAGTDF